MEGKVRRGMQGNRHTIRDTGMKFGPNDFLSVNYKIEVSDPENATKIRKAFNDCLSEVHKIWEDDQKMHKKSTDIDKME